MVEDVEGLVEEDEVVVEGVLVGVGIVMVKVESMRMDENRSLEVVASSRISVSVNAARPLSSPRLIGAESLSPAFTNAPPDFEQSHAPER